MSDRENTPPRTGAAPVTMNNFAGASGTFAVGTFGDGTVIGGGRSVVTKIAPEVRSGANRQLEILALTVLELTRSQALDARKVDLLAADLERLRLSIAAAQPDEGEFRSAATSLWDKLCMVSEGVHGITGLAQLLAGIAGTFGWKLAL